MVDRYSIASDNKKIIETFSLDQKIKIPSIYNAAPTKSLPVLTMEDSGKPDFFTWGIMSKWSNNKSLSPKLFNVGFEEAFTKRSYKQAIEKRRCIILADGFYLWKPIAKKKQSPYYFFMDDRKPFGIAGIWEPDDEFDETKSANFMMITIPSSEMISTYQSDMPFVMNQGQIEKWLDRNTHTDEINEFALSEQLKFSMHAVSPMIMDISNNSKDLIEPNKPADQHGNYTLFG